MSNQSILHHCWVCGGRRLQQIRDTTAPSVLESRNFAVTDDNYGTTGAVFLCYDCGFQQCSELGNVISYYVDLEDAEYEADRKERGLQSKAILAKIVAAVGAEDTHGLRLLDVGAGSGILLGQACSMGLQAEGIEPSTWLRNKAIEHGLKVHLGVLPHLDITEKFDIITVIDVIEHTPNPLALIVEASNYLKENGVLVMVTPNVCSLAARLMGWRWWHFRIAHVGYFSNDTLTLLCRRANLHIVRKWRPGWVFSLAYIVKRLRRYLPRPLHVPVADWMEGISIPLNFLDSLMVLTRKR